MNSTVDTSKKLEGLSAKKQVQILKQELAQLKQMNSEFEDRSTRYIEQYNLLTSKLSLLQA